MYSMQAGLQGKADLLALPSPIPEEPASGTPRNGGAPTPGGRMPEPRAFTPRAHLLGRSAAARGLLRALWILTTSSLALHPGKWDCRFVPINRMIDHGYPVKWVWFGG